MRERVGEIFDATVSGVTEHGFYASLDAPFVDTLCRVAWLPQDVYELDQYGVRLTGQHGGLTFGLGDRVRLEIKDVSIAQRKVLSAPRAYRRRPQAGELQFGGLTARAPPRPQPSPRTDRVIGRKKRKDACSARSARLHGQAPAKENAGRLNAPGKRSAFSVHLPGGGSEPATSRTGGNDQQLTSGRLLVIYHPWLDSPSTTSACAGRSRRWIRA